LNSLKREEKPPPFLEQLVITRLKESRLLHVTPPYSSRRAHRIALATAAALLIFVTGAVIGAKWPARTMSNSPQFMLILKKGNESSRPRSSEEVAERVAEYSSWARQLREQGVRVEGEKLKQDVRELGNTDARDLSAVAHHNTISGYFLVDAQNYDQAVKIASDCPHLKYGGTIEVRQIEGS
jgi:hypothetical protein